MRFWIVDADTRRPVRKSRYSQDTVLSALYQLIGRYPGADFLILDESFNPVPASVIRQKWKEA